MPFVAEDGTGFADANSLTSVAFADTYHAERGNDAWAALSTERKQRNLIVATDYVVGTYETAFLGYRAYSNQGVSFPRIIAYEKVGNPSTVQQATADLALVAETTPLTPNVTRGKKRVKVGPIEVEYDGNAPTSTMFVNASLKLSPYLKSGSLNSNQVRLIRV